MKRRSHASSPGHSDVGSVQQTAIRFAKLSVAFGQPRARLQAITAAPWTEGLDPIEGIAVRASGLAAA